MAGILRLMGAVDQGIDVDDISGRFDDVDEVIRLLIDDLPRDTARISSIPIQHSRSSTPSSGGSLCCVNHWK